MKEERCDGEANVSEIGPGNPYWSMPAGSTGDTTGVGVTLVPGVVGGRSREIGVGGRGLVGEGACACLVDEYSRALREAPAAADAATTTASVVFDIRQMGEQAEPRWKQNFRRDPSRTGD